MAILLFKLNNVPDDEAEDIRQLLHEHAIPTNETQAGRFKIGLAAIWLLDPSYQQQARQLIADYQIARYQNAQESRLLLKEIGFFSSLILRFQQTPVQFIIAVLAAVVVLGLTIGPFFAFSR